MKSSTNLRHKSEKAHMEWFWQVLVQVTLVDSHRISKPAVLDSLFNRVTGLRCFHVNFAKFLRTSTL